MVAAPNAESFLIHDATLLTLQPLAGRAKPRSHISEADLGIVSRGSVVVAQGVIAAAGAHAACKDALAKLGAAKSDFAEYDARGAVVMPGFVDAHTHALFAGNRVPDFEDLIAGRRPALGMRYTIEQTRHCSSDDLLELGARRLSLMLAHGTTTAEVKSGYCLTAEGELKLLDVLSRLGARAELPHVIPTFCGAHALPPEFSSYDAFVDELCDAILPQIAQQGVARYADAFCEQGFFSAQQSERFLGACAERGLQLRIHAEELHRSGGSAVAAKLRSVTADHLNFASTSDIAALAKGGCTAVLCPGTVEYLGLERYAPARDLIAAGIPVALATDFNPGTCPSFSLQMIAYLGRRHMQLSAPETIAAVTAIPAYSLGLAEHAGTLSSGSRGDIVLLALSDYREFGYYFGTNIVKRVFLGAKGAL